MTTSPATRTACTRAGAATALLVAVGSVTACQPASLPAVRAAVTDAPGRTALTSADGYLPDGTSVSPFDDVPAVTNLHGPLLVAVRAATRDAAADGVEVRITSGWRTAAYQRELFTAAVAERGSEAAAREYVLTPEKSAHVAGGAVDVGPTDATDWMNRHGSDHGLCQIYANEVWHFELATTPGGQCPQQLPDATVG